ncbi:MAG TPA: TQO small subunit DoxD [Candidatus Limnocylindrales bacterium]|nr:TQO small subunit DoxD [Candidatus Limnocylindrales bacterium]
MSGLRSWAVAIGAAATVLLFWMVNPWVDVPDGLQPIVTVAFWILAIALLVVLYVIARSEPRSDEVQVEGPAFARFLFNNRAAGLVWLPIRLFVGFEWLEAGWHKATSPGWLDGGAALGGFWKAAVAVPDQGKPAITYEWYREFLNFLLNNHAQSWFSWVVTFGEMAVGLGLILGALTGIAAFFGAFMNMSFLLAGSASTNPIMFTAAIGLILAWKVAGYYGVDRWLLPRLGTPWAPGVALRRPEQAPAT